MDICFDKMKSCFDTEFTTPRWDEQNGLDRDMLLKGCEKIKTENPNVSFSMIYAHMISFVLENAQLAMPSHYLFADQIRVNNCLLIMKQRAIDERQEELREPMERSETSRKCRAFLCEMDVGHTCPDWKEILTKGLKGILQSLQIYKESTDSPEKREFYECSILVYRSIVKLCDRFACMCDKYPDASELGKNYRMLRDGKPETLWQALLLMNVIYWTQHAVEGSWVRSLGRMDLLLEPYYRHDIETGSMTERQLEELFKCYFYRWNALNITANIPITLCGLTDETHDAGSDLTRLILKSYDELHVISPKFHIRCNEYTPEDILRTVCRMIRGGNSSFVFCNDRIVMASMEKNGVSPKDALDYVMVGCYEPTVPGKQVSCTTAGRFSLQKAVEYAMTGGVDLMEGIQVGEKTPLEIKNYDDFLHAIQLQTESIAKGCMDLLIAYENQYQYIHTSPVMSGGFSSCRASGRDAYMGGAAYNHTSINAFGLATAVDSILAVKKLVYDEKYLTVADFASILKNNWRDHEDLRKLCQNLHDKYGNHQKEADDLAAWLINISSKAINNRPNGRNGTFRLGAFSIDWRFDFGEHAAASADGRVAGETISKNFSANIGKDRNGVTALILSAANVDQTLIPNGAVLDVMLHQSVVKGEDGIDAFLALIKTYFVQGGQAIQFNILDSSTLRNAQCEPEKYKNLQVRLCGWNVLFVNLSKKEQDELIMQAENEERV